MQHEKKVKDLSFSWTILNSSSGFIYFIWDTFSFTNAENSLKSFRLMFALYMIFQSFQRIALLVTLIALNTAVNFNFNISIIYLFYTCFFRLMIIIMLELAKWIVTCLEFTARRRIMSKFTSYFFNDMICYFEQKAIISDNSSCFHHFLRYWLDCTIIYDMIIFKI